MSTKKFLLLTLKMHVEVTQVQLEPTSKMKIDFNPQAFCHSAPQLVTQLVMIWSGVSLFFSNQWLQHQINIKYKHQLAMTFQATLRSSDHLAGPPSWPWAAAWAEILAIILSFSSLIVTAARFES